MVITALSIEAGKLGTVPERKCRFNQSLNLKNAQVFSELLG